MGLLVALLLVMSLVGYANAAFVDRTTGSAEMAADPDFYPGSFYRWGLDVAPAPAPTRFGSATYTEVSAGVDHTCGIRTDQSLWCWGGNGFGQLGLGVADSEPHGPAKVGTATWRTVSAYRRFTCAVRTDRALFCWGWNPDGELGLGNTSAGYFSPTQVGSATNWLAITMGSIGTCATTTTNALYCWGGNDNGQVGQGDFTRRTSPALVAGSWARVTYSWAHVCAIGTDGSLWCWGWSGYGQLGQGDQVQQTTPTRVGVGTTWATAAVGTGHTCATRTDGTLWCWGASSCRRS